MSPESGRDRTAGAGARAGASPTRSRAVPPAPLAAAVDSDLGNGGQGNGGLYRVSFVCTGNICRSPMAEVITRSLAERTELSDGTVLGTHVDARSAGTGPWHEGEPMHPLAADALVRAGYPRHPHVAHQFSKADIGQIDFLVALDRRHQQTLRGLGADPDRLALLRSFDPASGVGADVPDPYYGDDAEFDQCLHMIEASCIGLVASLATHWDTLGAA
jgi:protein-tyrosine phosphatase